MTTLHMETDAVRAMASQLKQAAEALRSQTQALNSSAQSIDWFGPSRDEFVMETEGIARQLNAQAEAGAVLAGRVENEVTEWEQMDANAQALFSEDKSLIGAIIIGGIILGPLLFPQKVYAPSPQIPPGKDIIGNSSYLETFYEAQTGNTCGFQATRNILKSFGKDVSVVDLKKSVGHPPDYDEGTTYSEYEKMFSANGLPVDSHASFSSEDDAQNKLLEDIKAGKGVLARINVEPLDPYWGSQEGGHALWVTGVRTNEKGEVTHVICNDSGYSGDSYRNGTWDSKTGAMQSGGDGIPDGNGIEYPADKFMDAWSQRSYSYIATKDPIPQQEASK